MRRHDLHPGLGARAGGDGLPCVPPERGQVGARDRGAGTASDPPASRRNDAIHGLNDVRSGRGPTTPVWRLDDAMTALSARLPFALGVPAENTNLQVQ